MRQHTSEANIAGASLTLADYTSPGLVISSLRAQDAAAVIQELSAALQREGRVSDLLPFYHSALNREFLCSTATEPGWALPHALVKGLETACFALGRSTAPMVWMAKDKQRVQLVFLLAVPETDARAYMTVISGLTRLSKDARSMEGLLKAADTFEMIEVLKQVKVRINQAPS